jgi:DUF1680 family protein
MNLTDPAHLSVYGELNERIQRSIQHLKELNNNEMRMELTTPDEFWHWGADYMGRWIGSMSLLARYTGKDYGALEVARELLTYQNPDGSFGSYTDPHDFQEWFGMGRGLVGLLECYQFHPETELLEAVLKLGRYYASHYPDQACVLYECYSNALEGLVQLARMSTDPLYLDVARRMLEKSVVYEGIRYSTEVAPNGRRTPCAGQVHCQLSTARGMLDLYEFTGDESYLQPVLDLHQYILDELVWISGGIGFYYFRPEENETCADADWLRLNLQLWQLTRQAHYIEMAENILLNQLYFNQTDNGGFCYLRGLENRAGAVFDACCSHHGPRALYEVLRYIFTSEKGSTWINLYFSGEVRLNNETGIKSLESRVREIPGMFEYTLKIQENTHDLHSLNFRLPQWACGVSLKLNEEPQDFVERDGYAYLERCWSVGDTLVIQFDVQGQVIKGQTIGKHVISPLQTAVRYGPRLYCLNDMHNPSVRVHLARLKFDGKESQPVKVLTPTRLILKGSTPDIMDEDLVLSPLSEVGGVPSGAGRIHTVRSMYYKVWLPIQE